MSPPKPFLYTIVPESTLQSMLETFFECIRLSIQVIDSNGAVLAQSGVLSPFCRSFKPYLPPADSCERMHMSAGRKATLLGEPYIFECHAGLNHIVFPLIHQKTFLGSVLVGPFLMTAPDSLLISDLVKKYQIPIEPALDLYEDAGSVRVIPPAQVNHISRLLYYLFANLIEGSLEEMKQNHHKLLQQSRINVSIQRYKSEDISSGSYPYEMEKELIHKVKLRDAGSANGLLNDLLGHVLFSKGSSPEEVKARAFELTALLSRTAIEGGALPDHILNLNQQFMKNIQQADTLDSLCYTLKEIVETFSESFFHHAPSAGSEVIKKAMVYISKHFHTPLTLENVAMDVHLHPSYFSSLFKNTTGSSFKEYLNKVRVEEGKRLLSNTDYSIIDIAVGIGFEDQSYFSKVFKKYTGTTPKQYRLGMHSQPM